MSFRFQSSKIARNKLFHGFCFEYWRQDIKQVADVLNDHSKRAGTNADVAVPDKGPCMGQTYSPCGQTSCDISANAATHLSLVAFM